MILILEDTRDFERDKNISMAMTKGISKTRSKDVEEDSELLDMTFIQKYLAIARTQTPLLTKEAQEYMANNHATKRQESQDDPDGLDHIGKKTLFGGLLMLLLSLTCQKKSP